MNMEQINKIKLDMAAKGFCELPGEIRVRINIKMPCDGCGMPLLQIECPHNYPHLFCHQCDPEILADAADWCKVHSHE